MLVYWRLLFDWNWLFSPDSRRLFIPDVNKGKNVFMVFDKHGNLKYKFGNHHFWAEGYYVSTVGLNEATIAKYIREQEAHDIALDKLCVKEYEDPFKKG